MFLIDSLILLVSTGLLIRTLKREFANRLEEEAKRLDLMFKIFTVSYLIRTFMLTMQGWFPTLLSKMTDDTRKIFFWSYLLYCYAFFFWDILPIFLQLYWHDHSFKSVVPKVGGGAGHGSGDSDWEWTTSGGPTNGNEDGTES